jgi:hypothetical protein
MNATQSFAVGISAAQRLLSSVLRWLLPYNRTLGCITRCNLSRCVSFRPSTASAGFLPPGIFDAMKDSPVAVCGARIVYLQLSKQAFAFTTSSAFRRFLRDKFNLRGNRSRFLSCG